MIDLRKIISLIVVIWKRVFGLRFMIPLILAGVAIFLLTGPFAVFKEVKERNDPQRMSKIFVVASIYFLGAYGLHTMYKSHKANDEKRAWLMLVVGFISVLVAVLSLEVLM